MEPSGTELSKIDYKIFRNTGAEKAVQPGTFLVDQGSFSWLAWKTHHKLDVPTDEEEGLILLV